MGNIFSFVITTSLARHFSARVLLRIDDLDAPRVRIEFLQDIFDCLSFFDISFDEGPRSVADLQNNFSQLKRLGTYNAALEFLRSNNLVYGCSCSRKDLERQNCGCRPKQLDLDGPEISWRLTLDPASPLVIHTLNGPVKEFLPPHMQNFVVRKKDTMPAYQLCSLVDDVRFSCDLIVRGEDLLPSTLAQLHLAELLGYSSFRKAVFVHHKLLTDSHGGKLSKSQAATSVKFLRTNNSANELLDLCARMAGYSGREQLLDPAVVYSNFADR